MRLSALLATALLCASAHAAEVEFVRVWPGWRDLDSTKRISEYFTDKEDTGGLLVRRSQPWTRPGFYFLARVKHPHVDLGGAKFILHIIKPNDPEPKTFTFAAGAGRGEDVFNLGLTGTDWPTSTTHPVAWKLELLSADGQPLATAQSFLWEKPEK